MRKQVAVKKTGIIAAMSAVILLSHAGCSPESRLESAEENEVPKNIIFMIGDGMGNSYVNALRYMNDDSSTKWMELTAFDPFLVGQQMTYPEDPDQNVTDSAASGTAMATGIKTYNSAIGVDNDELYVKSILEAAKENGKATGLVSTVAITHATPASFGAHDTDRSNQEDIADDYFDELINDDHKIDVLLGGGRFAFEREDRNLIEEFEQDGYRYISTREELLENEDEQVLGLFSYGNLPYAIDRSGEDPSLAEMTEGAIQSLSEDNNGFFLMVEGGQIDLAGHDNDIVAAMSEMEDFEEAFKAAIKFAESDGETLVIATADHSTGGLSIGANGHYNWISDSVKEFKSSPRIISGRIEEGEDIETVLEETIGFELTEEEIDAVKEAAEAEEDPGKEIDSELEAIVDDRSHTGWTTDGHTGEDVPVFAFGPGSGNFRGVIDNTEQARNIFKMLQSDVILNDH